MSSTMTPTNTSIPIAKMVNDLFLQWLSLPDTRATLSTALHSVRTNSKMPEPIVYSKIHAARGGGFSKPQHFDSPPVSPVPRTPSSPRFTSSQNLSGGESTPGISNNNNNNNEDKISRLLKKNFPDNTTPTIDPRPAIAENISTPEMTKSDIIPSSPSTSTNVMPNRSTPSTTTTPSKVSHQTPVLQPPSIAPREPSSKPTNASVTPPSHDRLDTSKLSPVANTNKTPLSSNEQTIRATPATSVLSPQATPTTIKSEQKQNIPKFYFPNGKLTPTSTNEVVLAKQLRQAKDELFIPKHDKLHLEDFGKLAQLIGLSLYWKAPLFRACIHDCLGPKTAITSNTTISYSQFESFWTKVCKTNHDTALKFIHVLIRSSPTPTSVHRQYLTVDDWDYLVQDIIDTHPGLKFLREAKEFHSRYIKTVVARVYYNCNRSWTTKLTVHELRRSNFLQTFDRLEQEDDINRIHDYFSYEHFYVIYCKFWELDSDHDLFINRDDLGKHCNGAISNKMIDRIFSGAVSNSSNMKEGKMSYYEFVWFLISEEDKRSPTSIEYWFRCMDIDGDGILSMFELDYFYQEQVHKMEIYGIEYMPFEDCICQMLDLVKPEEDNKIRLKDLKRCKLTNVFFDTFFNLEKYLNNEQKDPFSNLKDPDAPELSDWVKFAETEYDNLTHEDGGNDGLDDDGNYDEDFEDDDNEVEEVTNRKLANNAGSTAQRHGSDLNKKIDDLEDELKRWKD